ncbi:hypothetical protein Peur_043490 [Populus x canadensis]
MEVKALDREMGQAMEVEVARVGMAVVEEVGVGVDMALAQLMVTVQLMGRPMAMDMVEAKEVMVMEQVEVKALDLEVGQAMEMGVEEKGLAQVMVVGQVMALDIEERKVKACREHKGYLFFYITPFIVICILK